MPSIAFTTETLFYTKSYMLRRNRKHVYDHGHVPHFVTYWKLTEIGGAIFRIRPDQQWGPSNLCKMGNFFSPRGTAVAAWPWSPTLI
jgi:hypothetical protein